VTTRTVEVEVDAVWLRGIVERLRADEDDDAARYAAALVLESLAKDLDEQTVGGEVVDLSEHFDGGESVQFLYEDGKLHVYRRGT
jgi:hypothetical protein